MTRLVLKSVELKPYEWASRCCLFVEQGEGENGGGVFSRPRIEWAPGPWEDEPDLVQWQHAASGYKLMIVRNYSGALCGYVGVPPEHPLHGLSGPEADDIAGMHTHWGLTYGGQMVDELSGPETWWMGFDCCHAFDAMPSMDALLNTPEMLERMADAGIVRNPWRYSGVEQYKTVEMVRVMCEELAEQCWKVGQIKFPEAHEQREEKTPAP